ncbi:MAG: hypothetical protein HRU15_09735, partial [Planctomycetes bacterium]|nr:hypothetical protein [Planctomycetota bacterium]
MKIKMLMIPWLSLLMPMAEAAISVSHEDTTLSFGLRVQSRIELADAKNTDGTDYDPWAGAIDTTAGETAQDVNFMIRRARLYLKGAHKKDTKFLLAFMADEIGAAGNRDGTSMDVRYAWVSHTIKPGALSHTFKFGLDKPYFISGDFDSSSRMLFATNRLSGQFNNERALGMSYRIKADSCKLAFDITEADSKDTATPKEDNNDLLYSMRFESGLTSENTLSKRTESFLGKDGFGHLIGLGFGARSDGDNSGNDF